MADALRNLRAVLGRPAAAAALDAQDWDALVRVAHQAGVLGRVAWLVERDGLWERVPERPRAHLRWSLRLGEACAREVRHEVCVLRDALSEAGVTPVLLKGAAYVCGGHDAAGGRFFRDIDLLVPEAALPETESRLALHGWWPEPMSDHDRRYYREWSHELPPLRHAGRGTVVDVHFNILPRVGRLRPDAERLLADAVPATTDSPARLSLTDLILHSAAHLFQNGEFDHGLRDLSDLDLLLRERFAGDADDWPVLLERAAALDLSGPLHLALTLTRRELGTPVPDGMAEAAGRRAGRGRVRRRLLGEGFRRALAPAHPLANPPGAGVARGLLYVRSHWLRMPVRLLVPHLARKWVVHRREGHA